MFKKTIRVFILLNVVSIFALSTYFLVKVENVGFFSNYMAVGTAVDQLSHTFDDPTMNTDLKWIYVLIIVHILISLLNIVLSKNKKNEFIKTLIYSSLPIYFIFSTMFASKIYIFESRVAILTLFYIVPSFITFVSSALISSELVKTKKDYV